MELQAIDVHTHLATREALAETEAMGSYFRTEVRAVPIEETAALYRGLSMRAVIFGVDRTTGGEPYVGNRYVADLAATAPDVLHKSNVWMDLSGWSPRYLPPSVIQHANTLLQARVLFGTDYPLITPGRWLRDFAEAGFKDQVRPKILLENARRLLRLS